METEPSRDSPASCLWGQTEAFMQIKGPSSGFFHIQAVPILRAQAEMGPICLHPQLGSGGLKEYLLGEKQQGAKGAWRPGRLQSEEAGPETSL